MTLRSSRLARTAVTLGPALALAACKEPSSAPATASPRAAATAEAAPVDAGPPADRTAARRVATLYHWSRTEPGNESTRNESLEYGTPKLHLVFEAHRDPQNRGWITVAALPGSVEVPENPRMRHLAAPSGQWHVPREGYTEFSLEQFGGELRTDEPIRVFLSRAPGERQELPINATPARARLPARDTLPASSEAAVGRYDAIAIAVIPVTARRGGRYLVYAVDMLPQPAGFPANGVMAHAPSPQEITRYAQWMRDPNGIGHSDPPIPMRPIDR